MELNQLRYLVTLSKTLNFSKAAEELYISQPSLSQQIRRLEEELGVQLVERSTRSVKMTPIGLACVREAETAVEAADLILEMTQEESRRSSHRLNLGVLAVFPQLNLSSVISEFQSMHLNEAINVHFDWSVSLLDRLRRRKSDVIITNIDIRDLTPGEIETLDIHPFIQDRLYLIVGERNPLYARDTVELREAIAQKLFLPGRSSSANLFFIKAVQEAGYAVPDFVECPSITSAFNFVGSGTGASIMSSHVSQAYIKPGMKMIEIVPTIHTSTALITRKELLKRPLVREFRDYFLERELNEH